MRGLHFRHMNRVAPDHQLMIARCNQIGGVTRRMSVARHRGHAGKDFALLEQSRAVLVGRDLFAARLEKRIDDVQRRVLHVRSI